MPYKDDQHLNFCWKTAYKKVILDAVTDNNDGDLYGQYPGSTMKIHAGCGKIPVQATPEPEPAPDESAPSGPIMQEDEMSLRTMGSLAVLFSIVIAL